MLWESDSNAICSSSIDVSEKMSEVDFVSVVRAGVVGLNLSAINLVSAPVGVR